MTQFEFLTIAFSILLTVTIVRLVEGLVSECRSKKKYWVHMLWVIQALLSAAGVWWSLWNFSELEWNYFIFIIVLIGPTLLFIQAVALIPREFENIDWKSFFYTNRRFYLLVSAFTYFYLLEMSYLLDGLPLSLNISLVIMGVSALIFAYVKKERAQEIFVVLNLILATVFIMPALNSL